MALIEDWGLLPEAAIAVVVAIIILAVWSMKDTPLPGPYEYPIVQNYFKLSAMLPRLLDALTFFCEKYGYGTTWTFKVPLLPRFVVVTDPKCVEHVLSNAPLVPGDRTTLGHFEQYPKGPMFQANLLDLLGHGIFNSDGGRWQVQRKTASHMFSEAIVRDLMIPVFVEHAEAVCSLLSDAASSGAEVDMQDLFFRYTLDSIAAIGFGTSIGSLRDPNHPFARAFDGAQWHAEKRFFNPLWRLEDLVSAEGRKYRESVAVLDEHCFRLIRERRASGAFEKDVDILSRFMRMKDAKGKYIMLHDDRYLRDVILNFLIAGRDTTAQALSWVVHMLTQHPDVEAKLVEEARSAWKQVAADDTATAAATATATAAASSSSAASGGASKHRGGLTLKILRGMTYTQAVVKETLRLYPSVPKDMKQASADDTLPDGTHIKAGWIIAYVPYAMGRSKAIWGDDAAAFKPERFVAKPNPSPYEYPVFNAGPRQCLGKDMAVLEATAALATIYRSFTLKAVPGQTIEPDNSLTMPMKRGIRVHPVPRKTTA